MSGMTTLILMKKAHQEYLLTKSMVSIGTIVKKFKNSNTILVSPRYKAIETLINSEELPIVMLLTSLRDELESQGCKERSSIVGKEIDNLFSISASEDQIKQIHRQHIKELVTRAGLMSSKDLLVYVLQVLTSIQLEDFFKSNISKDVKLGENYFFQELNQSEVAQLGERVKMMGF